mgnify:CR=1 FL=1
MISKNDQLLMGHDSDEPAIQPNSQYDTTISFNDSDPEPGTYSPRPDPNEAIPDGEFIHELGNGNTLSDFQMNFGGNNQDFNTNFDNFGGASGNVTGFQLGGSGNQNFRMDDLGMGGGSQFSPRPDNGFSAGISNVPTSPELAPLFAMISQFQPPPLEISPHYKPFLPDLIPSIGAIDAFIKVPRPDGEQDPLGLVLLDEPSIGCSNPQIMRMQLRDKFNVVGTSGDKGDGYIGFIDTPEDNQKALASFLESYDEISRNRAAPNIAYSYKMPEMEELMQFWPDELEKAFSVLPMPSADLDLSLDEFIRVVCALLDIPVKGNVVESLHVLFTLYQQFKENHYFTNATNGDSRGSTPVQP